MNAQLQKGKHADGQHRKRTHHTHGLAKHTGPGQDGVGCIRDDTAYHGNGGADSRAGHTQSQAVGGGGKGPGKGQIPGKEEQTAGEEPGDGFLQTSGNAAQTAGRQDGIRRRQGHEYPNHGKKQTVNKAHQEV